MAASDHAGFSAMYEEHYPAVLGYCMRRAHRDNAPDLVSEVFAIAWRRRAVMPAAEFVLPWLFAVASRTIANHRRTLRRRSALIIRSRRLTLDRAPGPEVQVIRRTEDAAVIEAVNRLRPSDREMILLSAWEGLSAPQIASRFNITVSASEKRLTRAKRRLGTELIRFEKRLGGHARVAGERGTR